MKCDNETCQQQEVMHCHVCGKDLDFITSAVSTAVEDSIYVCFGTLKQKIFVYGKYSSGSYGVLSLKGTYSKAECAEKVCENAIADFLGNAGESEYSRLVNCRRGEMDCRILTREMIEERKQALLEGRLKGYFPEFEEKRKHFCYNDAEKMNFVCSCGEKLIQLNSELYGELIGMDDTLFMEKYLPGLMLEI